MIEYVQAWCWCPKCQRMHQDAVISTEVRVLKRGYQYRIRQECDACLRRRAGPEAQALYREWRRKVLGV
jgi:hypothetical protein